MNKGLSLIGSGLKNGPDVMMFFNVNNGLSLYELLCSSADIKYPDFQLTFTKQVCLTTSTRLDLLGARISFLVRHLILFSNGMKGP